MKTRNYFLMLFLFLGLFILLLLNACKCPEIISDRNIKNSTITNNYDSIFERKLQLSVHFFTDSINKKDSVINEITNQVEMLNAILALCNDTGRTNTIISVQSIPPPKFKPFKRIFDGYKFVKIEQDSFGVVRIDNLKKDTIIKVNASVPDTTHYRNTTNVHSEVITKTVVVTQNSWLANACIVYTIFSLLLFIVLIAIYFLKNKKS